MMGDLQSIVRVLLNMKLCGKGSFYREYLKVLQGIFRHGKETLGDEIFSVDNQQKTETQKILDSTWFKVSFQGLFFWLFD